MRITNSMLNSQLLRDINNNLQRMAKNQERLSSQSMINKPSDDPVGATLVLRYREQLLANEQYQRNLDDALSWLEHYDTTLSEVNDILQAAREEAVRGANGTNPDTSLQAIAQKIGQLYDQLIAVGNTQFKGKYIFNGKDANNAPYGDAASPHYANDNGAIEFEVSPRVVIKVNLSGHDVFGSTPGTNPSNPTSNVPDANDPNAFEILLYLKNALETGDFDGIQNAIGMLDKRIDAVLTQWSDVGARMNRLELIQARLDDENFNLQKLLSKTQDTDVAEIYMILKTDENVYQASLSVGARIIQPSLVDFLR